jgi:hypothetical protein
MRPVVWIGVLCVACNADSNQRRAAHSIAELSLEGPLFTLSEGSTPAPWYLHQASGAILSSGMVVIGNYSDGRLMLFDTLGHLRVLAGGQGEGPGEFVAGVASLQRTDRGFAAWDFTSRRYSLFSDSGRYIESIRLEKWRVPQPLGWTPETGILFKEYGFQAGSPRRYLALPPAAPEPFIILGPAAPRRFVLRWEERGRRHNVLMGAECVPTLLENIVGNTLYVADTRAGTILARPLRQHQRAELSDTAAQFTIIYVEDRRQIVSPAIRKAIADAYAKASPDSLQQYLHAIGRPGDNLPAWSEMLSDPDSGYLFLRETSCMARRVPRSWTVVDTSGVRLGTLQLPAGRSLVAVGAGRVLALRTDSIDQEYAELYRLLLPRR